MHSAQSCVSQGLCGVAGRSDEMKMHESITIERVLQAAEKSIYGTENPGFCAACGADADGVEPDARAYECEECGENAVYGAEELLLYLT